VARPERNFESLNHTNHTAQPPKKSIDWRTLQTLTKDSGSCEACGLPGWAATESYKIPGVSGRFHSIACIECVLFGPHRCRWCGDELSTFAQRFCSETCRRTSTMVPFGNGRRLLEYVRHHHPDLYTLLVQNSIAVIACTAGAPWMADVPTGSSLVTDAAKRTGGHSRAGKSKVATIAWTPTQRSQ
jgi:hypothetical protein